MSKPSAIPDSIARWLSSGACDGYGSGSGYGDGFGDGAGYGINTGSGYGDSGRGDGDGSGYGHGSGDGDGSGYGHGSGDGDGSGYGSGDGSGYGDCDGSGYGSGYGIAAIGRSPVWKIDGVPTLIDSLRGDLARGHILLADLTLEPCYVARHGAFFAHGRTAREAMMGALRKSLADEPAESRIARFLVYFPVAEEHSGEALLEAHGWLTGSCEQGRRTFARERGIDLDLTYTVKAFCDLTRDAYGGQIIRQLEEKLL